MKIHEQIRKIRKQLGWTQAQLAEYLGKARNTVSRYESPDGIQPTAATYVRILELVGRGTIGGSGQAHPDAPPPT